MQKKWKKPEIIVLRSGQTQEAVLTHCKAVNIPGAPQVNPVGQNCGNDQISACMACQARPGGS